MDSRRPRELNRLSGTRLALCHLAADKRKPDSSSAVALPRPLAPWASFSSVASPMPRRSRVVKTTNSSIDRVAGAGTGCRRALASVALLLLLLIIWLASISA